MYLPDWGVTRHFQQRNATWCVSLHIANQLLPWMTASRTVLLYMYVDLCTHHQLHATPCLVHVTLSPCKGRSYVHNTPWPSAYIRSQFPTWTIILDKVYQSALATRQHYNTKLIYQHTSYTAFHCAFTIGGVFWITLRCSKLPAIVVSIQ